MAEKGLWHLQSSNYSDTLYVLYLMAVCICGKSVLLYFSLIFLSSQVNKSSLCLSECESACSLFLPVDVLVLFPCNGVMLVMPRFLL